jgi:hypothetical protein
LRGDLNRALLTCSIALVGIAGWVLADINGLLTDLSRVLIFSLANFVLIFDTLDLVVRIWLKRHRGTIGAGPSTDLELPEVSNTERILNLAPYAIIASVHDHADQVDRFVQAMQPFKDCVWLIDDASRDDTLLRLREQGWHCLASPVNRKKPAALAQLLKSLPSDIQTVVVTDPDCMWGSAPTTARANLELVISDLQRSGAAAFTPRVQAVRRGWLVECQAFEYELSCGLGRKSLGNLSTNSGVSVYRRSALEAALSKHTLSVYAEDFENSLLLLAAGESIYYDDRLIVVTEAKHSLRALFSQRVGWAFGGAKVFMERMPMVFAVVRRSPIAAYQYGFYLGLNGIALLPLKLTSIGLLALSFLASLDDLFTAQLLPHHSWNDPLLFALWYLKSIAVLAASCFSALPKGDRARHLAILPFYPLYALLQYVPMTVGYANLVTLRLTGRRLYKDHYDANPRIGVRVAGELA